MPIVATTAKEFTVCDFVVKEFALNGVVGVRCVGFSLAENRASKEGTEIGPYW